MMRFAAGFLLCVLSGWCTVAAQVMSGSNADRASGIVTHEVLSRDEIENQINKTEKALAVIKSPLDTGTQKIADQIRTFISHAGEAPKNDDLNGAGVLSSKARALVLELYKECAPHFEPKAKLTPIECLADKPVLGSRRFGTLERVTPNQKFRQLIRRGLGSPRDSRLESRRYVSAKREYHRLFESYQRHSGATA